MKPTNLGTNVCISAAVRCLTNSVSRPRLKIEKCVQSCSRLCASRTGECYDCTDRSHNYSKTLSATVSIGDTVDVTYRVVIRNVAPIQRLFSCTICIKNEGGAFTLDDLGLALGSSLRLTRAQRVVAAGETVCVDVSGAFDAPHDGVLTPNVAVKIDGRLSILDETVKLDASASNLWHLDDILRREGSDDVLPTKIFDQAGNLVSSFSRRHLLCSERGIVLTVKPCDSFTLDSRSAEWSNTLTASDACEIVTSNVARVRLEHNNPCIQLCSKVVCTGVPKWCICKSAKLVSNNSQGILIEYGLEASLDLRRLPDCDISICGSIKFDECPILVCVSVELWVVGATEPVSVTDAVGSFCFDNLCGVSLYDAVFVRVKVPNRHIDFSTCVMTTIPHTCHVVDSKPIRIERDTTSPVFATLRDVARLYRHGSDSDRMCFVSEYTDSSSVNYYVAQHGLLSVDSRQYTFDSEVYRETVGALCSDRGLDLLAAMFVASRGFSLVYFLYDAHPLSVCAISNCATVKSGTCDEVVDRASSSNRLKIGNCDHRSASFDADDVTESCSIETPTSDDSADIPAGGDDNAGTLAGSDDSISSRRAPPAISATIVHYTRLTRRFRGA